jgi:hypothetical protein
MALVASRSELKVGSVKETPNSHRIVLDLCGGTGAWSKPYAEAGYDVRNITLPDYDVCTYIPPAGVHGILAAPPCTEFSLAKTTAPRDFKKGLQTIDACFRIVWRCKRDGKLAWWALENPYPSMLSKFLGPPRSSFQPFDFGDPWTKRTGLWGDFQPPGKWNRKRPEYHMVGGDPRSDRLPSLTMHHGQRARLRAITPPGFAKAFFEANE